MIVQVGIPLPFNQILKFPPTSEAPRSNNLLHFIFFFTINQFWWWVLIVSTMHGGFVVPREKINVKHWMDMPLYWKLKAIVNRRHHLSHPKRAMAFGGQFDSRLINL